MCDGLTRLTAKKEITRLEDFFVTHIYRKKKLHELQHTRATRVCGFKDSCFIVSAEWRFRIGNILGSGSTVEGEKGVMHM